jgi:hypothetical protein
VVAKLNSLERLPALSGSQSTGALATRHNEEPASDSEIEDVLETALALDSKSGGHTPAQKLCGSLDIEAHLEELLNDIQNVKDISLPEKRQKEQHARVSDHHGNNENNIHRKGIGFVQPSTRRAKVVDHRGDNENKLHRKGTGFVHLSSLSKAANERHTNINDHHGDNENNIRRKGTGFVHLSSFSKDANERHASIHDNRGDNENNICRRGTGFVHLSSLPKLTKNPSVWFPAIAGGNVNHIQRKGTGFVVLNHVSPRVRIADSRGDSESSLQRKGTGFINLNDCDGELLPSSPGSCSIGTVDSPVALQNTADTDVASHEHHGAETFGQCSSLIETL